MEALKEVKQMIKEYNQDGQHKQSLDGVQEGFEDRVKDVQDLNYELKRRENRQLANMDDVWEKVQHEMHVISES